MPAPVVDVTLHAPAQVAPGVPFPVELVVRPPAGWHVYWAENPGQTGLPTHAELTGAPAGAARWSAPTRHLGAGGITSFVYEPRGGARWEVEAPGGAAALSLRASVRWLVCKEACVPGEATVTRDVRVRPGAPSRFPPARVVLPRPAPAALGADGTLRVCLPGDLDVFPGTTFEGLGVSFTHDGSAWSTHLPADAPPDAAVVFTRRDDPATSWRVDLATARTTPTCP